MSSYLQHYKIYCFVFFHISYFQATAASKILKFKHQNLKILIGGLLLILSAFSFTKLGGKHGNVIYKFVLITTTSFYFTILQILKLKNVKDNCFSPLNAYRNLFDRKV